MKKTERVCAIIKILSDTPSKIYGLNTFCKLFGAAKSSISEDLKTAREVVKNMELGIIETIPGAGGGVKFVPYIYDEQTREVQDKLCALIQDPSRMLGGGFLYTSDIMFDPVMTRQMAMIFARKFRDYGADYVVTIETKGIPLAHMTSYLLNIPTVVIRRESKISEGPTVSINYFSGSTGKIQKMSMAKRATLSGSNALVIDDFMRAGGSIKGIVELLDEFDAKVVGTGVAIATTDPEAKKISEYTPIVYLGNVDENTKQIQVFPNCQIFSNIT